MSVFPDDTNVAWSWGFSLRDQLAIDALDETTRAVVERYVRKFTPDAPIAGEGDGVVTVEEAYRDGFEDGAQEAADAVAGLSCYHVPKKYARKVTP